MLTFSASEEKLELYRRRCEFVSDIFEQLTNDASYDDARRAEKWNEWTALVFVRIEEFERTYGKYVPTPSGARRSGYVPPDS